MSVFSVKDVRAFLLDNDIPLRQHCAHQVAAYYARLTKSSNVTEDGDPFVFPSVRTTADVLGYSTRQVKRANAMLTAIGFIERVRDRMFRAAKRVVKLASFVRSKGDMETRQGVTRTHSRSSAPYISMKGDRTGLPTPTPPRYRSQPSGPVASKTVRERLRTGWRDMATA